MVHRDRPVRPEAGAERRVELQVAQAHRAQAEPFGLDLRADALDEVDQVERRVPGVDDGQRDAVGRQLAERLARTPATRSRSYRNDQGSASVPERQVRPWQDHAAKALGRGHEQAVAGDPVRAVGQVGGVELERTQRDPRDRVPGRAPRAISSGRSRSSRTSGVVTVAVLQSMRKPPLMSVTSPVMYPACSDARNATSDATSSDRAEPPDRDPADEIAGVGDHRAYR